jgi:hypothetical protein
MILPLVQRVILRPRESETCSSRRPALHLHRPPRHSPRSPQSRGFAQIPPTARAKKSFFYTKRSRFFFQ